ncbi:hypothetical protein VF03_28090, partial [Nostoc linckia z2]|uniref:hypothetical protein n=1 Tax=Nostoc linckia TaxID=92942 RepID=UPI000C038195
PYLLVGKRGYVGDNIVFAYLHYLPAQVPDHFYGQYQKFSCRFFLPFIPSLGNLQDLKTDIKVSQARYEGKKEMAEYYINDLYYQIHHKFYRAWDEIKEIQSFLQKDGFIVRTKPKEVPPPPKKVRIEEI